jgi:hypothetical protein
MYTASDQMVWDWGIVLWVAVNEGGDEVLLWTVVRKRGGGDVFVCVFLIKVSNMGLCMSVNVSFICKPFLVMSYI